MFDSFEPPVHVDVEMLRQVLHAELYAFEITFLPDSSTFSQDKASVALSYAPHPWAAHRLRAHIRESGSVITPPSQKQGL